MIYLDASCFVKLLRPEPFSREVQGLIQREPSVVVSSLCELETVIELRAGFLAGDYPQARLHAMERRIESLRKQRPFIFQSLSGTVFDAAVRQHRSISEVHCRTLDRLHLAAMQEEELTRLMTHDDRQAKAARALGYEVLMPVAAGNG